MNMLPGAILCGVVGDYNEKTQSMGEIFGRGLVKLVYISPFTWIHAA